MSSNILAIESSCDETSAAVISRGKVLNNVIATQSVHEIYGGVVPELASRAHQKQIIPVVDQALKGADMSVDSLDAIAYTKGPGLLGSLLVGASFAKSMAIALNIPLIGVHHMRAHILAHFIEEPVPSFPFLCLTISGGHTQIVKVDDPLTMKILGSTRDDAVGEAFDKCAKMLGLPYPGGPFIDKHAQNGDEKRFKFNKTNIPGLDFSFSGIKTGFLYFLRDMTKNEPTFIEENLEDLCASIQRHLIEMLIDKLTQAAEVTGIQEIGIAGGVSANRGLRKKLQEIALLRDWNLFIPDFQYCTDNAGMIAIAAHFMFENKMFDGLDEVPEARLAF